MLVSYNFLKEYVNNLVEVDKLKNILNTKAFEVEGVKSVGDDYLIDIDVLPNRAHDCLCHYGIAKEISILTGEEIKEYKPVVKAKLVRPDIGVSIKDNRCLRYIGRVISNIEIKESPKEIKEKLEVLGEKSINNVVDITNLVMFEIGQPMHAFDRDKIEGNIIEVSAATENDVMTTLDGKELTFKKDFLLVKDSKDPLALAGVKGGKKAIVDQNTTNIVLESANFCGPAVRSSSQEYNIKTESSKRFENEISPKLAEIAMERATELILKYASTKETEVSEVVDVYTKESIDYHLGVSVDEVNKLLGTNIDEGEIEDILSDLDFEFQKVKTKEKAIEYANSLIGRPHLVGASISYDAPNSFDCSSLVSYCYLLSGLSIPRISVDQYIWGEEVSKDELEPGDLIFSNTHDGNIYTESQVFLKGTEVAVGVDHVGMYAGNDEVIHSSRYKGAVVREKIKDAEQFKDIVGYRKYLPSTETRFVVKVPFTRLDLRIKEDLIEEIARIYGYNNIDVLPIKKDEGEEKINSEYCLNTKIRNILKDEGYSEVFTSTFDSVGEIEVKKAFASDKPFLKTTNMKHIRDVIDRNVKNQSFLLLPEIKVFEIAKVFKDKTEFPKLTIGRSKGSIKETIDVLNEKLNTTLTGQIEEKIAELDLNYDFPCEESEVLEKIGDVTYESISPYPFVLRDISVWVKEGESSENVLQEIKSEAGDLLVRTKLFDEYKKDGRVSYAFQLVFLSHEKTLTDEEINVIMDRVTKRLNDIWEVR